MEVEAEVQELKEVKVEEKVKLKGEKKVVIAAADDDVQIVEKKDVIVSKVKQSPAEPPSKRLKSSAGSQEQALQEINDDLTDLRKSLQVLKDEERRKCLTTILRLIAQKLDKRRSENFKAMKPEERNKRLQEVVQDIQDVRECKLENIDPGDLLGKLIITKYDIESEK
jgi:uncharacterized coiled-coil protein SlyX